MTSSFIVIFYPFCPKLRTTLFVFVSTRQKEYKAKLVSPSRPTACRLAKRRPRTRPGGSTTLKKSIRPKETAPSTTRYHSLYGIFVDTATRNVQRSAPFWKDQCEPLICPSGLGAWSVSGYLIPLSFFTSSFFFFFFLNLRTTQTDSEEIDHPHKTREARRRKTWASRPEKSCARPCSFLSSLLHLPFPPCLSLSEYCRTSTLLSSRSPSVSYSR